MRRYRRVSMAFRSIDNKSRGSPNDVTNSTDATREVDDAVTCRCSIDVPQTTHDVVGQQPPSGAKNDDSAPSPSTPLRQRRLPASFWQEPNVPRRSSWCSVRRSDAVGSTSPQSSPFRRHHQQPSFDCCRPATLLHRRQYHCGPSVPFPAWTRTDRHDFLPDWNDASAFNFDVPAKPQPASAAAVDFVRHFAHLSPWSVVGAGLPGGYPLLGAPDYVGHGGSLTVPSPSDELAASAAVVAAYLRWRAAEEGCKPVAETTPTSPSVADWSSMMWRPCSTATTASFAVQRLHRYHPY